MRADLLEPPRKQNNGRASNGNGHRNNGNGRPARRDEPAKKPEVMVPGHQRTHQNPNIEVSNDSFADAAIASLPPDLLYRSAGTVGVLSGAIGSLEFDPVGPTDFRLFIDEHMRLINWTVAETGNVRPCFTNCNENLAKLVHSRAKRAETTRKLVRIVQYPVYGPNFIRYQPGWSKDGTYFDSPAALAAVEPETDQARIMEILEDLVVDFPFKDESSRHNFFGLLLTPILRPALDGNVPLHLVLASLERTGKSKLLEEVMGGVILGRPTPALQMSGNDEELDKRILALLMSGETLVHMDNLGEFLNSPVLASLLTSTTYHGRELGRTVMRRVANTLNVTASGNNVRATGEIVKRTVPIRLQPIDDHPEFRSNFVHANLRGHVASVRPAVLCALLGMVERWKSAGRPAGRKRMGGFEEWARVVGGVMTVNGFDKWLDNADEWRKQSDPDTEDLRTFVNEWAREHRDKPQHPAELLRLAQRFNLFPAVLRKPSAASAMSAFAKTVLARNVDRPVHGFLIERDSSGNNKTYRLTGDEQAFLAAIESAPADSSASAEEEVPDFFSSRN